MTPNPTPSLAEKLHDAIAQLGELLEAMRDEGDCHDLQQLQRIADHLAVEFHVRFIQCDFEPVVTVPKKPSFPPNRVIREGRNPKTEAR